MEIIIDRRLINILYNKTYSAIKKRIKQFHENIIKNTTKISKVNN